MMLAVGAFIVVIPLVVVAWANRRPTERAIARAEVTVLGSRTVTDPTGRIMSTMRRRRGAGAVGAVAGLWATAGWSGPTFHWDGLVGRLYETAPGLPFGAYAIHGGSWFVSINYFGILCGFAAGLLVAEWRATRGAFGTQERHARLEPRVASAYLAPWTTIAVCAGFAAASFAALGAQVVPDSLTSTDGATPGSPWWAIVLLAVALIAMSLRTAAMSAPTHATTGSDLDARHVSRVLTSATLTIVTMAALSGSAATSLARLSMRFGWGWGDGLTTLALVFSHVTIGLVVAAFATPYWVLATRSEAAVTEVTASV